VPQADYDDKPNEPNGNDQAVYPPYRFFDPYAGSSNAAGAQQYADEMNQESSSEAINA
jgi:endoglucanase Acf2